MLRDVPTEVHPLYSVFLGHLFQCIFQWSDEDLELLKSANANRAANAVTGATSGPESYSGALKRALNDISMDVLGRKLPLSAKNVGIYTGEFEFEWSTSTIRQVLRDDTVEEDVPQPAPEPLSDLDCGSYGCKDKHSCSLKVKILYVHYRLRLCI